MALKAKIEAIIYAAEEPITVEQISALVKDIVLSDLSKEAEAQIVPEASDAESLPEVAEASVATEESGEAQAPVMDEPATEVAPAIEAESSEAETSEAQTPEEVAEQNVAEEPAPADSATVSAPEPTSGKRRKSDAPKKEPSEDAKVRARVRLVLEELVADYEREDRGMEIRQIAGGYRMGTKPEHHDVVRAFAKSLKPPVRLSLAALETLAVIAYKQPITVPEISEIRGVEAAGVIGTLLERKLITTAGRKQVIGRPILYKTSKEFLLRFGLNEVSELPSMEEFEKLASDQADLFAPEGEAAEPAPAELVPSSEEPSESAPDVEANSSSDPGETAEEKETTVSEEPTPAGNE